MIRSVHVIDVATGERQRFDGPAAAAHANARHGKVVWLDVVAPDDVDTAFLLTLFAIHPLTLEDLRHAHQRPKLEQYDGYYQLVLYAFDTAGGQAWPPVSKELTLLVGADYVVTVQATPLPQVEAAGALWSHLAPLADELPAYLAYLLIDAVVDSYFPVVEAVHERITRLEEAVIAEASDAVLQAIFVLKKETLEARRWMTPLRDVFLVLMRGPGSTMGTRMYLYYQDVLDHLLRVGDGMELQRELLGNALDLHMSTMSNRTNDTMKKLTVLSAILMTAALVSGIYGMNFKHMPELGWLRGYPAALWIMATASWGLVMMFRWWRFIGTSPRSASPPARAALALSGLVCLAWGAWLWLPAFAPPAVTRAGYMALAPGMDLAAVERTLGTRGEEATREDAGGVAKEVYTWLNADGSSATVTFTNGQLALKACERLR